MSYANGTTHYNLPQTVGTDKRDWFDTNQAFADIDEALYGAVQQSASTAESVTALTTRVGTVESSVATIQSNQAADEANISALQTLTSQHTTQIADVKADALDMICAVDEGTAQVASVAVSEGDYFRYNDVLYMATTAIAVGDTIVPNTNCRATNVATELESQSTPSASDVTYGSSNVSDTLDSITAELDDLDVEQVSVTESVTNLKLDLKKSGHVYSLHIYDTAIISLPQSTWTTIGTITDATAIPAHTISILTSMDGTAVNIGYIRIESDGAIKVWCGTATISHLGDCITYIK